MAVWVAEAFFSAPLSQGRNAFTGKQKHEKDDFLTIAILCTYILGCSVHDYSCQINL